VCSRARPRRRPDDALAYFGPPDLFAEADEVHVSVTFTADKAIAERLAEQWRTSRRSRSAAWPTATQPRVHPRPLHQARLHDHVARLPAPVLVLRRLEEVADAERAADL
jgi:hypothetical protein